MKKGGIHRKPMVLTDIIWIGGKCKNKEKAEKAKILDIRGLNMD